MRLIITAGLLLCMLSTAAQARRPHPDTIPAAGDMITVQPVLHGTLVLEWQDVTIYVDPYGGADGFNAFPYPDIILITHTHGDHLDPETLNALNTEEAIFVVPQSVADELPPAYQDQLIVLDNGEEIERQRVSVRAVPMYNLPDDDTSRHPRGWGNGYVLNLGGKDVYISGDTEDIPEMRGLEGIDIAFVCMNLPYTMDIHQAASAVLDFEPVIVYPYHYRGQDTAAFKELVNAGNEEIEVRLRDWYPGSDSD